MKLQKCFTIMFSDYLKEHGFQQKGVLFYRMNGDILQGVTLHTGNVQTVTLGFFPYWIIRHQSNGGICPDIKKGVWADEWRLNDLFSVKKAGGSGTNDIVMLKGEYTPEDMMIAKNRFQGVCMPLLDRVRDLDSYIHETVYYDPSKVPGFENTRISYTPRDLQRPLLLKAYRDGSFDHVVGIAEYLLEKYKQEQIQIHERNARQSESELSNTDLMDEWEQGLKDVPGAFEAIMRSMKNTVQEKDSWSPERKVEEMKKSSFPLLYEKYEAGDLEWIHGEYETLATEAKGLLLKELKLQVECPIE